jgi:hypothetical protein
MAPLIAACGALAMTPSATIAQVHDYERVQGEGSLDLCGGTWTSACASVQVQYDDMNRIRVLVSNDPRVVGTGDASNSVITQVLLKFTSASDGASLKSGVLYGVEDAAGNDLSALWGLKTEPNNNKDFFNQVGMDWTHGLATLNGNGKPTGGLCNGIIADAGTDPTAFPNCDNGFPTTVAFVFDFGAIDRGMVQTMAATHHNNIASMYCADPEDPRCESDWATAVPEPITTVLVGSGLLGLGGAGWIRRRRRGVEEA